VGGLVLDLRQGMVRRVLMEILEYLYSRALDRGYLERMFCLGEV